MPWRRDLRRARSIKKREPWTSGHVIRGKNTEFFALAVHAAEAINRPPTSFAKSSPTLGDDSTDMAENLSRRAHRLRRSSVSIRWYRGEGATRRRAGHRADRCSPALPRAADEQTVKQVCRRRMQRPKTQKLVGFLGVACVDKGDGERSPPTTTGRRRRGCKVP